MTPLERPPSFVPEEWVSDLIAAVHDGRKVTIPAGHEIHVGDPAAYLSVVRNHLDT